MKKLLSILIIFVLSLNMCSCAYSADGIKSNLKDAGYDIIEFDEERKTEMNNELKYSYRGSGSIINGFYGVSSADSTSVTVLEFEDKSDLTIMYKMVKESLKKGECVDLSGYILIFGDKNGVNVALNK